MNDPQGWSHGINQDDWLVCTSIYCYDLTVDQKAFDAAFHPTPKVGHYKINATFSDDITAPISMIIVQEYDSKLQYKETGEISKSYIV